MKSHVGNYALQISLYAQSHKVSLGLLLSAYGAFYLATVILSGWSLPDWGKDMTVYAPFAINGFLPRSYIAPMFFVTSVPALVLGTGILCRYCLRGLGVFSVEDRERVAILLTAFGFAYVVIGAWPLGNVANFPWDWQKQIVSNGAVFTWGLYALSLVVLAVGVFSVYRCSKIYHQTHPEFSLEN